MVLCLIKALLKTTFSSQESKKNVLQEQIRALDRFRNEMSDKDREAFDDFLHRTDTYSSISYLSPRQSPFEQPLQTIMIEIHKKTEKLKDEVRWKLKA